MASVLAGRWLSPILFPYQWLRQQIRRSLDKFLASRSGPFKEGVILDSSRVYIVPTRVGFIFCLLLVFLLLGSINYTKSLGFMLTFLLAALGNVAMLMTWRNLAGIRLKGTGAQPVYAGQSARFAVQLESMSEDRRYSIGLRYQDKAAELTDVPGQQLALLHFEVTTGQRGYCDPGRIRVETEFPLGLFVAWTWVDLGMKSLVYPAPADHALSPASIDSTQSGEEQSEGEGLEDFAGIKKFQEGDSWRRISWKTVARTGELYSKEFTGGEPEMEWIDWQSIDEPRLEKRLSIMVRMLLNAQQAGRLYGVRLPTQEIKPDNGAAHLHRCLETLALYRPGGQE